MVKQPHPTTPEHRAEILARIGEAWARAPYLRLGQLLINAERETLFWTPDRELVKSAESWLNELERLQNTEKSDEKP